MRLFSEFCYLKKKEKMDYDFVVVYAVLVPCTVFEGVELAVIDGYPTTGTPVAMMIPTVLVAITL